MMEREYLWMPREGLEGPVRDDGEFRYWVTNINDEIPIVIKSTGPGSEAPTTILQHVEYNARVAGEKPAFREFVKNKWAVTTWMDVWNGTLQVVRGLMQLGVPERSCVSIIGFNSVEWVLAYLGSISANCIPVGIYTTSQPSACAYLAKHSDMQVLFAKGETDIKKYLGVLHELPNFKAVVCFQPSSRFEEFRRGKGNFYTWTEFMNLGKTQNPAVRLGNLSPGAVCSIVYTSGTTGPPKGAMLSHDNYISLATSILSLEAYVPEEHLVSYLPLSHTAGQVYDIIMPLLGRFCVSFADEKALAGTLMNTVRAVKPTFFFAVPRIYEKIEAEIRGLQRRHPNWTGAYGVQKIRATFGFDRTKVFGIGAAPSQPSMLSFFKDLGIVLLNSYGMTESCGPTTFNKNLRYNLASAGFALPGINLRIVDSKNTPLLPGIRGEICFKGRNKFLGYYKNPQQTRETIDSEGYIHSGDEGYVDEQGFLFITGRYKELIITAGGENIPPVLIEDQIKAETKVISNVMLVGDARKYIAALITLRSVIQPDGSPSDILSEEAMTVIQAAGSNAATVTAALVCPKVRKIVDVAVEKANEKAASRAQYIRKWRFLPQDFSIPGGELTPTMKLRRSVVLSKYSGVIDSLYTDPRL